jgi:hypothetical protein
MIAWSSHDHRGAHDRAKPLAELRVGQGFEALQAELAAWSPRDDHAAVAVLTAKVGTLHAELIKAEAVATDHRANFAAERSRCDAVIAELLKATADLMAAKEATARLDGELAALRARRWWKRLAG